MAVLATYVADTVEYLCGALGEEAWTSGMNPDVPDVEMLDNPYRYTDYRSETTHQVRDELA